MWSSGFRSAINISLIWLAASRSKRIAGKRYFYRRALHGAGFSPSGFELKKHSVRNDGVDVFEELRRRRCRLI